MAEMVSKSSYRALELELARVKSRLAVLESADGKSEGGLPESRMQPEDDPPEKRPFPFLDLPHELRNAIYELCVVVGKVYIHEPGFIKTSDMRCTTPTRRPQLELFRVSKQLHDEARDIYLAQNMFVQLARPVVIPPDPFPLLESLQGIRQLSVTLDYRSWSNRNFEGIVSQYEKFNRWDRISPTELQNRIHGIVKDLDIREIWRGLFTAVDKLRTLKRLQINIQNCYCPWTCCRDLPDVFVHDHPPTAPLSMSTGLLVVDVIGTRGFQERQLIRWGLGAGKWDLQFHGALSDAEGRCVWDENQEVDDDIFRREEGVGASEDHSNGSVDEEAADDVSEDNVREIDIEDEDLDEE